LFEQIFNALIKLLQTKIPYRLVCHLLQGAGFGLRTGLISLNTRHSHNLISNTMLSTLLLPRTNTNRFISKTSSLLAILFVARTSAARAFSTTIGDYHRAATRTHLPTQTTWSFPTITNNIPRGGSISLFSTISPTEEKEVTTIINTDKTNIMTASQKLTAMRSAMKENGVDVYIVPSDDPHLSEYVPAAYMRRAYLTDFHGSAGTAAVTADKAYLWTDSRYVSYELQRFCVYTYLVLYHCNGLLISNISHTNNMHI